MFYYRRIVGFVLFILPNLFYALGLGNASVQSSLGEPLQARIEIVGSLDQESARSVFASVATIAEFKKLGIERSDYANQVNITLREDREQHYFLELSTRAPIDQSYLDLLIDLKWPSGNLMREYTLLFDPPDYLPAKSSVPEMNKRIHGVLNASSPSSKTKNLLLSSMVMVKNEGLMYGPVAPGDMLWTIAEEVNPGDQFNTSQVMLALLAANPRAFMQNNVNGLLTGSILKVPTSTQVSTFDATAAHTEVAKQNRAWYAYLQSLNVSSLSTSISSGLTGSTVLAPSVLTPSGSATDLPISNNPTKTELAITTELLATAKEANQILKLKIDELQQSNQTMSAEMQRLQGSLQNTRTSSPSESAITPAPATSTRPVAPNTVSMTSPPRASTASQSSADEKSDTSVFSVSIALLIIVGICVWIFRGYLWRIFNSQKAKFFKSNLATTAEATLHTNHEPTAAPPLFTDETTSVNKATAIAPSITITPPLQNEPVQHRVGSMVNEKTFFNSVSETLQDVDTYLSYGRLGQAENTLLNALKDHSGELALWKKLAEVYVEADNKTAFDSCVKEIPNSLFEHDFEFIAYLDTLKEKMSKKNKNESTKILAPSGPIAAETPTPSSQASVKTSFESRGYQSSDAVATQTPEDSNAIDFENTTFIKKNENPTVKNMIYSDENVSVQETDIPETLKPSANQDASLLSSDEVSDDSFSIDISPVTSWDEKTDPPPHTAPSDHAKKTEEIEMEIVDMDFDNIASKLDLARAYVEMGDQSLAKPLLDTVIAEGNTAQQAEAKHLLSKK